MKHSANSVKVVISNKTHAMGVQISENSAKSSNQFIIKEEHQRLGTASYDPNSNECYMARAAAPRAAQEKQAVSFYSNFQKLP